MLVSLARLSWENHHSLFDRFLCKSFVPGAEVFNQKFTPISYRHRQAHHANSPESLEPQATEGHDLPAACGPSQSNEQRSSGTYDQLAWCLAAESAQLPGIHRGSRTRAIALDSARTSLVTTTDERKQFRHSLGLGVGGSGKEQRSSAYLRQPSRVTCDTSPCICWLSCCGRETLIHFPGSISEWPRFESSNSL